MRHFLPFLLFLFIIAAVVRADFFFSIAYLFFIVYWLARLWLTRAARNLHLQRRFTPRAFFGDEVEVSVVARNRGRLPIPWLELHESLPVELAAPPFRRAVASLGGRGEHRFQYTLYCRKRGCYGIGPLAAHTGDLLGLFAPKTLAHSPERLIVYPRVVPLERLGLPTRSPLVALPARSPLFEDPARVTGVRHYQPGDSLRRIHWTASASSGQLLVKQYQPAIARDTLICLDLDEAGYAKRHRADATELAIVAAASLANHIVVRERLPVGLATEAFDPLADTGVAFFLPPRREEAQLMSVLEVLARVQATPASPLPAFLRRASVRLPWGTTVVVITGGIDEAVFDTFAYMRRIGLAVAWLVVQPDQLPVEVERRAEQLGVPAYPLWSEAELEQLR
jgi:uncharacterized protein (DUF58 family)